MIDKMIRKLVENNFDSVVAAYPEYRATWSPREDGEVSLSKKFYAEKIQRNSNSHKYVWFRLCRLF